MRRANGPRRPVAPRVAGYAVVAAIGLQIAAPATALVNDPPARFGFQMYSALGGVSLEAVDAAGEPVDVELETIVAGTLRPELDWTGVLPEQVCRAAPDAVRVTVEQDGHRREVPCS